MKIEIIETNENQLFERKDIKFKIMQTGATPSEKDVLTELAKTLKIDDTFIVIDAIHQKYSALECLGLAKVFKKAQREKKVEEKPATEEPKTEAKKEEEPKTEAKKEEEPKTEAKKEKEPKAEAKKEEEPKAEDIKE